MFFFRWNQIYLVFFSHFSTIYKIFGWLKWQCTHRRANSVAWKSRFGIGGNAAVVADGEATKWLWIEVSKWIMTVSMWLCIICVFDNADSWQNQKMFYRTHSTSQTKLHHQNTKFWKPEQLKHTYVHAVHMQYWRWSVHSNVWIHKQRQ